MRILGLLCGIGALLASSSAFADPGQGALDITHPTIRVDNGIAVPMAAPQYNYFGPGGFAGLKLAFNLTPWLDVGPSVETIQLSERGDNAPVSGVGGTWAFGLGARLKRPHNMNDSGTLGAVSPWIGAEYQYYNTGGLGRMGAGVAVGISSPMDRDRHWWLGPVVGYNQITDGTSVGGTPGNDTRDARIGWMGLELEFDVVGYKHRVAHILPPVVYSPPPVEEKKLVVEAPPPPQQDPVEVVVHTTDTIQFNFDSAVLSNESKGTLDQIAEVIAAHLAAAENDPQQHKFKSVQVDGFASLDHVWAKEHDQKLSEQRAQAVVDYLVSKGVPSNVLSAKGFGTSNPVASNDTKEGREANRRVEFELTLSFIRGTTQEGGQ